MDSKYNARLLKAVFGEPHVLLYEEELANDENLNNLILDLLEENSKGTAFYLMHEYFLEGKNDEEMAQYVRENAEKIAKEAVASVLRSLRRPENAKQLKPFMDKYKKEN
jgi:hypothetical protein